MIHFIALIYVIYYKLYNIIHTLYYLYYPCTLLIEIFVNFIHAIYSSWDHLIDHYYWYTLKCHSMFGYLWQTWHHPCMLFMIYFIISFMHINNYLHFTHTNSYYLIHSLSFLIQINEKAFVCYRVFFYFRYFDSFYL